MQIAQILQLRVAPRATPGATPMATPKMMYYCACPTQTAARIIANMRELAGEALHLESQYQHVHEVVFQLARIQSG